MAGFLSTTELDFNTYRDNLKAFLRQQDRFKDYDFDGPNMAVLLDVLAYNTYNNGMYLNLIGSEMFFDTAQLRQSIVSHAKELNYTPRSRTSAVAYVDISISGNNMPAVMTIPKNYPVNGRTPDGQTFTFLTKEAISVGAANNHTAKNVPVYEGKIVSEAFVSNSSMRYILQSSNVDISSIEVKVQQDESNTAIEEWKRETTLFGLSNNVPAFFVQGYEDYNYELAFGNGVVGKKLTDGSLVRVNYRTTLGEEANGVKTFTASQAIEGFSTVKVALTNDTGYAQGGAEHESDSEIKFNAPRYFQTQERAVVTSDYETLLRNEFPQLGALTAFGGETVEPKKYGKTIISAKPRGSDVMPNSLKEQIVKFLKNKTTLSIDPIIVDPDFFHVQITTEVFYDINKTVKTPTELSAIVSNAVVNYNTENLDDFGSDLRFSRLVAAIDDADVAIVSNDTKVLMTKKLYPLAKRAQAFSFSYGNAILQDDSATLYSSPFEWRTGNTTYNVYLEDDGAGKIRIVTIDLSDNKVVLQDNVGTVNYATGAVTLSAIAVESLFGPSLNIYAQLVKSDVETNNSQILTIDPTDLQITVTGIRI
jgi:hypothetical protein